MADFSIFTGAWVDWILNPLIWLLIILFSVGAVAGFLLIRKRRKLIYPSAEIIVLNNGKTSLNFLGNKSAGWFGKHWSLFKLWDSGPEVLRIKDGTIVEEFSEEDFLEVNGKRAVVFVRNPESKLLFPINKLEISEDDRALMARVAPASYTEVSADILKAAEAEIKNTWEKILPIIMFGVVVIFALVSIIVITQMVKNGQQEASKLIVEAGKTCLENAKSVCSQFASIASNAP